MERPGKNAETKQFSCGLSAPFDVWYVLFRPVPELHTGLRFFYGLGISFPAVTVITWSSVGDWVWIELGMQEFSYRDLCPEKVLHAWQAQMLGEQGSMIKSVGHIVQISILHCKTKVIKLFPLMKEEDWYQPSRNTCAATKAILFEVLKNDSSAVKSTVWISLLYGNIQDSLSTL